MESPEGQRGFEMCIISDTKAQEIAVAKAQAKNPERVKLEENH